MSGDRMEHFDRTAAIADIIRSRLGEDVLDLEHRSDAFIFGLHQEVCSLRDEALAQRPLPWWHGIFDPRPKRNAR